VTRVVADLPGESPALLSFAGAHPLFPSEYKQGALRVLYETEQMLCAVTGLEACSLQPSAGAHGELTGIMLIQAWHRAQGNTRTKMLIPDTAHGTNPASAALCGFSSVKVPLGPDGILTVEDVAALMDDDCAGIMITNPNTLGLFESNIKEIAELVHARGGLVYGDGANLNAIMGYAHMGHIGIDVMHMNLHKTFSTPHGGGGPGSGAICVSKTLVPFLPGPRLVETDG
jgi:Glycine cleavage system protein P (pyridoxal-binding), C-terminal domain